MAKDKFHDIVKEALIKDDWTITNDPLRLNVPGEKRLLADLGGSKIIGASLGEKKIAVEIKGFHRPSILYDFHAALGQYLIYEDAIERQNLNWEMHLAIPEKVFRFLEQHEHILYSIQKRAMKIILFDQNQKSLTTWIN